jgi:hypothetical protein
MVPLFVDVKDLEDYWDMDIIQWKRRDANIGVSEKINGSMILSYLLLDL